MGALHVLNHPPPRGGRCTCWDPWMFTSNRNLLGQVLCGVDATPSLIPASLSPSTAPAFSVARELPQPPWGFVLGLSREQPNRGARGSGSRWFRGLQSLCCVQAGPEPHSLGGA